MRTTDVRSLLMIGLAVLALAASPAQAQKEDPNRYIDVVESYLSLLDHMRETTSDPRGALFLAQNSMKEIYEKKGQKAEAVTEIRKILEGVDDPAVRTAARFAIADIYKETGQMDRALEEIRLIVQENKALLGKKESKPAPAAKPK